MKKLISLLLAVTSFSYAGIIENKTTGETIEFELDRKNQEVQITSSASGLANKVTKTHDVKVTRKIINLLN